MNKKVIPVNMNIPSKERDTLLLSELEHLKEKVYKKYVDWGMFIFASMGFLISWIVLGFLSILMIGFNGLISLQLFLASMFSLILFYVFARLSCG